MKAAAQAELQSIKYELDSIINELESISTGIRQDFRGIGNERCAECIERVTYQYRVAKRKLSNINTSKVKGDFVAQS